MKKNRLANYIFYLIIILLVSACADNTEHSNNSDKTNYQEIEWEELDPNDPQEVEYSTPESLGLNPESFDLNNDEYIDEYNQLPGLRELTSGHVGLPSQAYSVGVVSEMDGKNIRLPGFIVPVEFEGENLVTEFFLVPYFGACIHQPPPPPNQTIYVTTEKPIKFQGIYDPVWVMGTIKTERTGNDIATAAYKIDLNRIEAYTE